MARRGTFAFDLSKPVKRGPLLKQGALHKAFKARFFVLYPGFLVYYESENKWRIDLSRGETLGNRIGAVKLKGSTVGIARNAPKACKFGIGLTAPDPANKRTTYVMNAFSKEERDSWIEALHTATPISPHLNRKDVKPADKPKEGKKSSVSESESSKNLSNPKTTLRQDTACDAAIAAANCTDSVEDQKAVDEVVDIVTNSLKNLAPMVPIRHDTATMAALTLSVEKGNGFEEDKETNIDLILGSDSIPSSSEDGSSTRGASTTPESGTSMTSPEPEEADKPGELEGEGELGEVGDKTETTKPDVEAVKPNEVTELESNESSQVTSNGEVTVMTTVAVEAWSSTHNSQESSQILGKKKEEEEAEDKGSNSSPDSKSRTSSTIILVHTDSPVITINLNNYDSDDTLSGEESHTDLTSSQHIEEKETKEEEQDEVVEKKAKSSLDKVTVKEDRNGIVPKGDRSGSDTSSDSPNLSIPNSERRRTSVPFIEKKGYLYKMGGQRKTWKLRYFVLRPGVFDYFKDSNPNRKVLGEVKLKNLSIFFPGIGERKQSYQFTIHTESSWNRRPDYILAAQSEREMKEWIVAFKLAGQKVGSGGSSGNSDTENGY